jgi:hypothetical protein
MQQLMDLYLAETAPMLDGLGEAFTRPLRELEQLGPQATSPGHTRCLPMFVRNFRASRVPSRNLSKHCRPPIHNP